MEFFSLSSVLAFFGRLLSPIIQKYLTQNKCVLSFSERADRIYITNAVSNVAVFFDELTLVFNEEKHNVMSAKNIYLENMCCPARPEGPITHLMDTGLGNGNTYYFPISYLIYLASDSAYLGQKNALMDEGSLRVGATIKIHAVINGQIVKSRFKLNDKIIRNVRTKRFEENQFRLSQ